MNQLLILRIFTLVVQIRLLILMTMVEICTGILVNKSPEVERLEEEALLLHSKGLKSSNKKRNCKLIGT